MVNTVRHSLRLIRWRDCLRHTQVEGCSVAPYSIDLNYAEELRRNVSVYKVPDKNIINEKYEDEITKVLY